MDLEERSMDVGEGTSISATSTPSMMAQDPTA